MNSLLIITWPGAEQLSHQGALREAQENILHPQKNLQVLGQRVPPPLVPRCPFLGATAGCDSLCVWWSGYHTHGKRVTVSKSSGGVMGGDSSPAARARTSLRSDIASGQRDRRRQGSDLPCPATSGHLHQTRGGVRSCQKHLGFLFASSPALSIWTNSKHRSAGEFLVIMKAGSIEQTQQNRTDTVRMQKTSVLSSNTPTSAVPGSPSKSFLSWHAECLRSIFHINGTARK